MGRREAATELLSGHKWAEGTWKNRSSQMIRRFSFCEEGK